MSKRYQGRVPSTCEGLSGPSGPSGLSGPSGPSGLSGLSGQVPKPNHVLLHCPMTKAVWDHAITVTSAAVVGTPAEQRWGGGE